VKAILVILGLVLVGSAAIARADAVAPPPTGCPRGTHGESSHTGPYCAPALCTTDADCTGGATCQDETMCIAQQACGGLGFDAGPFPDGGFPPPCMFDSVHGLCESGGACTTGTCSTRRVCAAAAPAPSAGCACSIGGRGYAMGAWLAATAIAITLVRRTRRSPRSR
jgi:hypothetical protein